MATVAADRFEALGPEKTALLFPIDHTHTSAIGADMNAHSVATALRTPTPPSLRSYGHMLKSKMQQRST